MDEGGLFVAGGIDRNNLLRTEALQKWFRIAITNGAQATDLIVGEVNSVLTEYCTQRAVIDEKIEPPQRGNPFEVSCVFARGQQEIGKVTINTHRHPQWSMAPARF